MNIYFKGIATFIFTAILLIMILVPLVSSTSINDQVDFNNQSKPLNIDWWPKFRYNENQIGFSTSSAPDTDDVLWSYQTESYITSSPAVIDGKVYVGSWDKKLYCFDMMTGDVLWNFTTGGKITSSPAIDNGKVYIGSQDSKFYCLDADNGDKIWEFDTDFMIESSPTIIDNKVLFGNSGGSMFCLNVNDGSLIWSYPTGNVILSSPAVNEDRVYFGSASGLFFCVDLDDGELVWSNSTDGVIESSPTINDGKVYFGSKDNFVYCLDAEDGGFIWNYDTGGEVHSSPAIAYGYVYIGSSSQGLFCLNAESGDLIWEYLISGGIWSPPSVADGKVYYGTDPCCGAPTYIHCNDAITGERIWKHNTGGFNTMKSSPAIAAGKVFVGADSGIVFAFGGNELYANAHGPYYGIEDDSIQFMGSAYGGKPDYKWHWDFGNGESSNEQNPEYTYMDGGNYLVTLTVTDDFNDVAIDETTAFIEEINFPPTNPTIEGPLNGKIGEEYEYCISSAIDPDGDNIYVYWDWGDGNSSSWLGPYLSGEKICEKHIWYGPDDYIIRAKLRDEKGAESDWGTLQVKMPKTKNYNSLFLHFLISHPHMFPLLQKVIHFLVK